MNKINDILLLSWEFDDNINKYNERDKILLKLTNKINNLENNEATKLILNLLELHNAEHRILSQRQTPQQTQQQLQTRPQQQLQTRPQQQQQTQIPENTLLFFVSNNTERDVQFFDTIRQIKVLLNNEKKQLNIVSTTYNPNDIKKIKIFDFFNVKTTPVVKLVANGKIIDYDDMLSALPILKFAASNLS